MKITFEGIDTPGDNAGPSVPDGYSGMDWTNFIALDPAGSTVFIPSGANNGIVSGSSVALNGNANPATFSSLTQDFELRKAFFTAAWNNGLVVTVQGWDDGALVATKTFVVNYAGPTKMKFGVNFASIDTVIIDSSGGTDANGSDNGAGEHFVVDDILVHFEDVVPTRVAEHDFDVGHDALDPAAFSRWMLA